MADVCDDADKNSQSILEARIANHRAQAALVPVRSFERCQNCGAPTLDGLPYCDAECHADHAHALAVVAKQFARSS